jgi:hypothetical protein
MKAFLLFPALVLASLLLSVPPSTFAFANSSKDDSLNDSVRVSLVISTEKTVYNAGEPVSVVCIFRNLSEVGKGIFIWNYFWRDCHFIVKDERGRSVQPHPLKEGVDPYVLPRFFYYLDGNEQCGKTWMIAGKGIDTSYQSLYHFEPYHTYTITCSLSVHRKLRLLSDIEHAPPDIKECAQKEMKAINLDYVWEGDIISNSIKIRIIK